MPVDETSPAPPRLPLARRLLYAALTTLLFAAALEGTLAALGLANPAARLSLTRGFSTPRATSCRPAQPGGLRTQMFSGDSPGSSCRRAPRRARAAHGRAAPRASREYIRECLDAALPDPGFGSSTSAGTATAASACASCWPRALELQPDVVFIYLGHNGSWSRASRSSWRGGGTRASRSGRRLAGAPAHDERRDAGGGGFVHAPAALPRVPAGGARGRLPRADLRPHRALLQGLPRQPARHGRAGARRGRGRAAATVVANDFDPPSVSTFPADLPESARRRVPPARPGAGRDPGPLPVGAESDQPERGRDPPASVRLGRAGAARTWSSAARARCPRRRRCARCPGPSLARRAGATRATGPSRWRRCCPPMRRSCSAPTDDERRLLSVAAARLPRVLTICPDHPLTLYELGLVRYLLGDNDGARACCTPPPPTTARRRMAATSSTAWCATSPRSTPTTDVRCVDADQLVRAACPRDSWATSS